MAEQEQDNIEERSAAIGIDLGTTYSCVAVWQYGMVEVIANDQGERTTPSYVAFTPNGRLIGDAAKAMTADKNLSDDAVKNIIYDAKRLIGRLYKDDSVKEDMKHFTFNVLPEKGKPVIQAQFNGETKNFEPEEISSMILSKLKNIAEEYLGTDVTDAVITVPAYFNDAQRQATKDAGTIAGLNVLRIINEPTAAAMAYGMDKKTEGEKNILIFDLGGGTFDVSILTIEDGVFEVKATSGNTHLGGEDFDSRMVNYFVDEIRRKNEINLIGNKKAIRRLRTACENVKRALSSRKHETIEVEALLDGGADFKSSITRAKFEELCKDLFDSTLDPVDKALEDAKMGKDDIHEVVLVGGSTRIPRIQKLLSEYFDDRELNMSINPDEAVAYGAAVQAAILNGTYSEGLNDLLLLDVTPLTFGIQTVGGKMTPLIPRNTTIPAREKKIFSTSSDEQTTVWVQIFEGERELTKDNNLLGRFQLKGIPKAKARVPQIEVAFDVDANGILNVSAVEKNSGINNQIEIKNIQNRLTKEQIARKVKEAELYREHDAKQSERISQMIVLKDYAKQLKSTADSEKFVALMLDADKNSIATKIEETLEWIDKNTEASKEDYENIKRELEDFAKPILDKFRQFSRDNPGGFRRADADPANRGQNNNNSNNQARKGPIIEEID